MAVSPDASTYYSTYYLVMKAAFRQRRAETSSGIWRDWNSRRVKPSTGWREAAISRRGCATGQCGARQRYRDNGSGYGHFPLMSWSI
ncbi:MAG TPA: hypothetical protein VET85_06635, partial [Stellaceae bacterium]|nr:hypothetical protein [Stellaceae bacterium]